jgi:hypothetical protein
VLERGIALAATPADGPTGARRWLPRLSVDNEQQQRSTPREAAVQRAHTTHCAKRGTTASLPSPRRIARPLTHDGAMNGGESGGGIRGDGGVDGGGGLGAHWPDGSVVAVTRPPAQPQTASSVEKRPGSSSVGANCMRVHLAEAPHQPQLAWARQAHLSLSSQVEVPSPRSKHGRDSGESMLVSEESAPEHESCMSRHPLTPAADSTASRILSSGELHGSMEIGKGNHSVTDEAVPSP